MVNKAIIVGFVGKDPDIRGNGTVASFSVATNESWKDKATGERKEVTDWHNVVCFNENLVKVIKDYVKKGSRVYVEGKMRTRKYEDKQGIERYAFEVVLSTFNSQLVLCDKSEGSGRAPPPAESEMQYGKHREDNVGTPGARYDSEIPF